MEEYSLELWLLYYKVFIFASIIIHQISNTQMIVETNVLDYTLIAILLIIIEEKEINLVTLHSHMFKITELNYDIYNKELLAVFEAFCILYHYLKRSELPIDIIMDHKNLEYFSTTKIVSYC